MMHDEGFWPEYDSPKRWNQYDSWWRRFAMRPSLFGVMLYVVEVPILAVAKQLERWRAFDPVDGAETVVRRLRAGAQRVRSLSDLFPPWSQG